MTLGDFLVAAAANRGPWNCSTMPADWCVARGHADFAAAWRDHIDDARCDATVREAGSLLSLWELGIGDALPVVDEPQPGDIAVLAAYGMEVGGIFTGDKWATRSPRGVLSIRWPSTGIRKVWRP